MDLTIDMGNTRTKYVVWDHEKVIFSGEIAQNPEEKLAADYNIEAIAWSNTSGKPIPVFENFKGRNFVLDHLCKLPFKNLYKTPETLGKDRMAAIAGAMKLWPHKNTMVIDAGTCITTDLVNDSGTYFGGSISPGLTMRYQALHTMTGNLPLIKHRDFNDILGLSTEESILTGVGNGILGELNYRLHECLKNFPDLVVILTGGDAPFLANHLKYRIFAEPLLVHYGLLYCLKLNEF